MTDIEYEVAKIIKQDAVKRTSEEILDKVRERLSDSDGLVLLELNRGGLDIVVHYSCPLPLAIYASILGKQLLVDKKVGEMEITEDEDENEDEEVIR